MYKTLRQIITELKDFGLVPEKLMSNHHLRLLGRHEKNLYLLKHVKEVIKVMGAYERKRFYYWMVSEGFGNEVNDAVIVNQASAIALIRRACDFKIRECFAIPSEANSSDPFGVDQEHIDIIAKRIFSTSLRYATFNTICSSLNLPIE